MRYIASALLVLVVFLLVTGITANNRVELDPMMYDYMVRHFEEDTHSKNAVAAILLNYRMYDTMFEALILLAAIIGMTQFLPRAADIEAGRQAHARASAEGDDSDEDGNPDTSGPYEDGEDGHG